MRFVVATGSWSGAQVIQLLRLEVRLPASPYLSPVASMDRVLDAFCVQSGKQAPELLQQIEHDSENGATLSARGRV